MSPGPPPVHPEGRSRTELLAAATEISEATRALELVLDERETRNREDTAMTNLMTLTTEIHLRAG